MSELLESKWQDTKVALLEGLTGNKKSVMSATLENTRKYLAEAATAGATGAGNVATLNRVILPVIRRVMPTVIANENRRCTTNDWSSWTNPHTKSKICRFI